MTRPDLDAIRARLLNPNLTAEEFESIMETLSCIEERENPTTYTVGETEWANRIANAEQTAEEARDEARAAVEQETVKLREEFLRLRVETGRHRKAAALSEERALTAEERLEQMTRERDEARAQLAAIDTGSPCDGHRHCCADRRKLAEELLRVRAERDEAVKACADALAERITWYQRGREEALKEKP